MSRNSEQLRFLQDIEFAQSLANIDYVLWLAKQGYFEQPSFLNYLDYLEYLSDPEYAIHLIYPRGIEILSFLKDNKIRDLLREDPLTFRRILLDQLWSSWARKEELDIS
jgi:mediator of RNA polymerase II transcription subunit 31